MSFVWVLLAVLTGAGTCLFPFRGLKRTYTLGIDLAAGLLFPCAAHILGGESATAVLGLVAGRVVGIPLVASGGSGLSLLIPGACLFVPWPVAIGVAGGALVSSFGAKIYREIVGIAFFMCAVPFFSTGFAFMPWAIAAGLAVLKLSMQLKDGTTVLRG